MSNILDMILTIFLIIALIFLTLVILAAAVILLWLMVTYLIDAIQERKERKKIKEILNQK